MNNNIHHEHLISISQHDWYVCCFDMNHATRLEDVIYRVLVQEQGQDDIISFTNLRELALWAGY